MESLTTDQIRVLDLLPGEGAPVRGVIRVVTLSETPQYEALSYVWGSPSDPAFIELAYADNPKAAESATVEVTKSLLAALRRLRRIDAPRTLWIDQLCIDQTNIHEKAAQVRLMRAVYSQCTRALLWMGEGSGDVSQADIAAGVALIEYMAGAKGADAATIAGMERPSSLDCQDSYEAALAAIAMFGPDQNTWWTRVWTVQEAILPPDCTLLWGPTGVHRSSIEALSSVFFHWNVRKQLSLPEVSRECSSGLGSIIAQFLWMKRARTTQDDPIANLLRWRIREATDPRDNIYALTGLHPTGTLPRSEKCRYDLKPYQVFARLTLDLIFRNDRGDLLPLCMDPRLEKDRATQEMPRWALDMASVPDYARGFWAHVHGYRHYNANGGLPKETVSQETPETLSLQGVLVDVVRSTGEGFPVVCRTHSPQDSWLGPSLRQKWYRFAAAEKRVIIATGRFREEMLNDWDSHFNRLLIGDVVRTPQSEIRRAATRADVTMLSHIRKFGSKRDSHHHDLQTSMAYHARNQRFFITETGFMGLGHLETKAGDEVWVFNAGRVPFLVRKREGSQDDDVLGYDFVGWCYVQGIMRGELFSDENVYTQKAIRLY